MTQPLRRPEVEPQVDTEVGVDGPCRFDVVVPTVGRRTLPALLASLLRGLPPRSRLIVVDDRAGTARNGSPGPLPLGPCADDPRLRVLRGAGRGPAAARNRGWRSSLAPWIAFLDDDVHVPPGWMAALEQDLRRAGDDVAAVQGRVRVPLPAGRAPSDWERNVHGLATARWITADLAVRRRALEPIGGFDERFRRAYREDSDLALRLLDAGWRLQVGGRALQHPVGPAPWWVSVPLQRGNADDVLMERIHGSGWRHRVGAPPGAYTGHRVTTAAAALALGAAAAGRRWLARAALAWWLMRTASFAWSRIASGPRTPGEAVAMAATSVAIPPAACTLRLWGHLRWRGTGPRRRATTGEH